MRIHDHVVHILVTQWQLVEQVKISMIILWFIVRSWPKHTIANVYVNDLNTK